MSVIVPSSPLGKRVREMNCEASSFKGLVEYACEFDGLLLRLTSALLVLPSESDLIETWADRVAVPLAWAEASRARAQCGIRRAEGALVRIDAELERLEGPDGTDDTTSTAAAALNLKGLLQELDIDLRELEKTAQLLEVLDASTRTETALHAYARVSDTAEAFRRELDGALSAAQAGPQGWCPQLSCLGWHPLMRNLDWQPLAALCSSMSRIKFLDCRRVDSQLVAIVDFIVETDSLPHFNFVQLSQKTLLTWACQRGCERVVQTLLALPPRWLDHVGAAFFDALNHPNDVILDAFLALPPGWLDITATDRHGWSVWHVLCKPQPHCARVFARLLAAFPTANLNVLVLSRHALGTTPLWAACKHGASSIVDMLLALPHGRVDLGNYETTSPLQVACTSGAGFEDIVLRLVDEYSKRGLGLDLAYPFMYYCCCAYYKFQRSDRIAREMLDRSESPSSFESFDFARRYHNNITPLMAATKAGFVDIVRRLLSPRYIEHVDLNAKDADGCSAFGYAMKSLYYHSENCRTIVQLFLETPVDVNCRNGGETPLLWALLNVLNLNEQQKKDAQELFLLLLSDPRVDVNARHVNARHGGKLQDKTALMIAVMHNLLPCVKAILSLPPERVDLTLVDPMSGDTAFFQACGARHGPVDVSIVKEFLSLPKARLDVHAKDRDGRYTALDTAELWDRTEVVLLLQQHAA